MAKEIGSATLGLRDVMTALRAACIDRSLVGSFLLTPLTGSPDLQRTRIKLRVEPMRPPTDVWEQWSGFVLECEWSTSHSLTLEGLMYRLVLEAYCADEEAVTQTQPAL